jgi:hypothetical protein
MLCGLDLHDDKLFRISGLVGMIISSLDDSCSWCFEETRQAVSTDSHGGCAVPVTCLFRRRFVQFVSPRDAAPCITGSASLLSLSNRTS